MAPQRSADGFLASAVKAASTGILPVLAVAALLSLAGCGGGGSAESTEATATANVAKGSGGEAADKKTAAAKGKSGWAKGTATQAQSGADAPTKQGPKIKQPKGPREQAPTPQQQSEAVLASISLQSPALHPGPESVAILPAAYACDGKDTSPPLRWSGIPAGTEELVLFALNLEPVNEALFFDWAVAGIDPSLTAIEAGSAPRGAVLGQNSFGHRGYSICPPPGKAETIVFALYALPEALHPKAGFDPMGLRTEVLARSHNSGLMAVSYAR